jgi:MFS family permease
MLDGFDTTIYAFVLVPALKVILPASGVSASDTPHWGLTFFAIVSFIVGPIGWRGVFFIGIIPAVLLFYIRFKAQEPERWLKAKRKLACS